MEKLGFRINDQSTTSDQKQTNPQESRLISIQRCISHLVHCCQCRDTNCHFPSCHKMKRVVQHAKCCKQKTTGCPICKQLLALCLHHAKSCQIPKCPVLFCVNIKNKIKHQQLQQRLQEAQILRRCITTMQECVMSDAMLHTSPGTSNSSSQPSPAAQPHSSPQPGIGMKPTTGHPVGALQDVQTAAALCDLVRGRTEAPLDFLDVLFTLARQQSSDECIICYEKTVECALYRCGHTCMCYNCAFKLWKSNSSSHCPICRSSIQDVIKIYK